jgi:SH3 domain-containing protein
VARPGRRHPLPARFLLAAGLLAAGLLDGCASVTPGTGDRATDAATERARAEKLQESYRQLEQSHQQLQREHEQVVIENQRLTGETQRLTSETQRLQRERQALQDAARRPATPAVSEEELARLRLQLMEKDAQIRLLTQKLDAAILEVVRALAKLRSIESKAEAATTLAEAEIALKMLERNATGREKDPDVVQAEGLLKLGGQEFRKDNYSGALYLSSQAKSLIKDGQPGPAGERAPRVEGEVPFALPLPLRLVGRGEAREGPGPNFKVAFALADGAPVVAHSYKGLWVKIRGDDGRSGWVRYNLVGQR